jgi:uncharacterized protein (TIGR02271 family)
MAKTVIGYFEQTSEAQSVLQDLLDHRFDRDHISLIAHQERAALEAEGTSAPRVIAVPGVGPVQATGPLAAGLSSTTGGPSGSSLLDVLTDYGVSADEAQWYLDALRRGGALIAVETSDADADRAVDIMKRAMQPGREITGRIDGATAAAAERTRRFEDYEADFQRHHRAAHPGRESYAEYTPAYRYGYTLATEPRYAGRDWSAMEAEARRDWEARHQGAWDEFKDAVFYGWEHIRGRHQADAGKLRIPVVEEAIHVETRQVERGGVRISSHVTEQPVEQKVHLRDERVTVERRPVDRPATERDLAAFKEGTIELTETREEALVSKQARVVEEVVIEKNVRERTETVRDSVRRTEVDVEPVGEESTTRAQDFAMYERDFRKHYDTAFGPRGSPYDHWAPAYRYGYDIATDARYRQRDWAAIETDARRDWEQRHKGTWEEFKGAIRYAWDTVRGRR